MCMFSCYYHTINCPLYSYNLLRETQKNHRHNTSPASDAGHVENLEEELRLLIDGYDEDEAEILAALNGTDDEVEPETKRKKDEEQIKKRISH